MTTTDPRFAYHAPTAAKIEQHQEIRESIAEIVAYIEGAVPPSRERSLAATKLEEAMFWANAAVARNTGE